MIRFFTNYLIIMIRFLTNTNRFYYKVQYNTIAKKWFYSWSNRLGIYRHVLEHLYVDDNVSRVDTVSDGLRFYKTTKWLMKVVFK